MININTQTAHRSWYALFFAMAILLLGGCAASGTHRATGEVIDDAAITTKVKAALVEDKQVSALDVKVETFRGVVQLSGFADSQTEISRAVTVARGVNGVKSVKNDLRLKPSAG